MTARSDFWSRRKAAVEAEQAAELQAVDAAQQSDEQAALDDKTDAEILAELDLPDPDSLSKGDDFTAFLARRVPERIRRRALRKLWLSNPVLANLDELVDYGEDYTDAATIVENMQTVYQVGKGMVRMLTGEDEEAAPEDAVAEDVAAEATEEEDEVEATDLADTSQQPTNPEQHTVALAQDAPEARPDPVDPDPLAAPTRRRMRFAFAD
ncbi:MULTISPECIES: DUF3306 domain-containing protein [unclassified Meridianimarinicoccus]|uniref:DUF3306 domain-containing protein n=1 Tax=unclassified Meridianimarinicoccus TaxID=2923344 RepID=UPI0018674276|nr:DUF3306 domain-containing protein [Fluviibacterium sp. MJW13]